LSIISAGLALNLPELPVQVLLNKKRTQYSVGLSTRGLSFFEYSLKTGIFLAVKIFSKGG
jgi:hypothetical protein